LAIVAAIGWIAFCLRFGQLRRDPRARVPLYAAALALGALSIAPTTFLVVWQELVLHLSPTGNVVRDALFYVMGVGFREELSKLLLFLPLLPILLRRGQLVEVVTCGALVGLGFAAVENLQYFSRDDLGSALGRFLTANFLHMSMTALTATAAYRMVTRPEGFHDFTVTFLTVVAMHGFYDFFLDSPLVGDLSFFSMTVFVFLARDFVLAMHDARLRAGRSKPLLPVFAVATATVCGATFVYASLVVGPGAAAEMMYLGLLGVAVLTIVFVRQLRVL
jgi:RsiW-degrading membrane proteinase PrsW (M82 family)